MFLKHFYCQIQCRDTINEANGVYVTRIRSLHVRNTNIERENTTYTKLGHIVI